MSNSEVKKRPSLMVRKIRRVSKNLDRLRLRLEGYDNSQAILLESYKAIYFQIPKVASTAIKKKLKSEVGLSGRGAHNVRFPLADPDRLSNGGYSDYYSFGFVRNPWTRILSCYKAKICKKANINGSPWLRFLYYVTPDAWHAKFNKFLQTPILSSYMSFDEFVEAVARISDQHIDKHLRSQYTFLCDKDGELQTRYLGRLESFTEDFQHVASQIGLPLEEPRNTSPKKKPDLANYYNQRTWDLIANRYSRDIELLGYSDCRL